MPPKSKKQQQEEAKRLEAERLRLEQQQRLLQIQKAKYASVQISTGLTLPVTTLLLQQFSIKPIAFIKQKLIQYLNTIAPHISKNPIGTNIVINHILDNILFTVLNFGFTHRNQKIKAQNYEKARVFIGIMLQVFKNDHPWFRQQAIESSKDKNKDWSLFKQLILKHSYDAPPQKIKYFDKQIVKKIIDYAEKGYFGHFSLLTKFDRFVKKTQIKTQTIFIDQPQIFLNNKQTPFTDLVVKQKQQEVEQKQQKQQEIPVQ